MDIENFFGNNEADKETLRIFFFCYMSFLSVIILKTFTIWVYSSRTICSVYSARLFVSDYFLALPDVYLDPLD